MGVGTLKDNKLAAHWCRLVYKGNNNDAELLWSYGSL